MGFSLLTQQILSHVNQRRLDMRSDYVIVLLTQQLLSRRSDLTFSVFGFVIW